MRELPTGRMLWLSATMLFALIASHGCQSTSPSLSGPLARDKASDPSKGPAASAKNTVVHPGMEIEWSVQAGSTKPGEVRSGHSIVAPDGTLPLGPYGTCRVAGLTLLRAGGQVEKQLSAYVKQPHVTLTAVYAPVPGSEIAWKKAIHPPLESLASYQGMSPSKDNSIRPVGFQPPLTTPELPLKGKEETPPPPLEKAKPAPTKQEETHPVQPPHPLAAPPAPSELNPVVLPSYVIRPPDVLLIDSQKGLLTQPIRGQHLVRPDGTVGVGIYGPILVAGKTVMQAREDIARVIHGKLNKDKVTHEDVLNGLSVDVLAYNSAVYYVITDGAGLGEQVFRFPVMGSETVLDAISNINGLPVVASPKRIWLARRNPGHSGPYNIYPVDWKGITQQGAMNTNWQIMPGDRVYVQADPMRRFNNNLSKFLEPVERVLGATLLGAQTSNALKGIVPR